MSNFLQTWPDNPEAAKSLLNVNMTATDSFGNSLLHMVAHWGANLGVFDFLIKGNADIHLRNAAGQTFLHVLDVTHLATQDGDFSNLLVILKDLGFQFDARDHRGRSILLALLKQQEMLGDPLSLKRFYGAVANEEALWNACLVKDNHGDSAVAYLRRFVNRGNLGDSYKAEITHLLERCVSMCT